MLLGILEIAKSKVKPMSIAKLPKSVSFLSDKLALNNYSGTPPYGHPRKVTIYNFADTLFGLKCIYICSCTIKIPEMQKPQYSVKWTGSPAPCTDGVVGLGGLTVQAHCLSG